MDFSEIVFPDHAGLQLARPNSLGSGAFGITWLVRAPLPGFVDSPQVFVLKVLKTGIVPKPGSNPRSDFVEESDMLQRLRHQGVPRVVGRGFCRVRGEETPYYLTEYEDAIDLERLLKDPENAKVDADFAIRFLTSVLEVLEYCHRHQVLHLDIKPDNILVGSRGKPATLDADSFDHAVLIDFGKAKAIDDLASGKYTTAGGGSFHYVHPALHSYLRPNKVRTDLFRESGPGFDLFSLSAVLTRDLIPKVSASGDAPHYVDLLRLLADKLKNPDCTKPGLQHLLGSGCVGLFATFSTRSSALAASDPAQCAGVSRDVVSCAHHHRYSGVPAAAACCAARAYSSRLSKRHAHTIQSQPGRV